MRYNEEQRAAISRTAKGKTVESLEWTPHGGGYWVMAFADGSEISFRLLAELVPAAQSSPSG